MNPLSIEASKVNKPHIIGFCVVLPSPQAHKEEVKRKLEEQKREKEEKLMLDKVAWFDKKEARKKQAEQEMKEVQSKRMALLAAIKGILFSPVSSV